MLVKPALCLDFDGTIRYSIGGHKYVNGPDDIALFDDVEAKIWKYKDRGYLILGITNQGVIAKGKPLLDVANELATVERLFQRNPFDAIYYSPTHPDGTVPEFSCRSLSRKPAYGLLAHAEHDMNRQHNTIIDWDNSLFVGDMETDRQCAQTAGVPFMWAWKFFGREKK